MQMSKGRVRATAVVALLGLLLGGCGQATDQPGTEGFSGTLTISGAWALYPMMVRWSEEFHALHPDHRGPATGGTGQA